MNAKNRMLQFGCLTLAVTMIVYVRLLINSENMTPQKKLIYRKFRTANWTLHTDTYFVNTSTCKIPDLGAFNEEIMPYYKRLTTKVDCLQYKPLTYTEKVGDHYTLRINSSVAKHYSYYGLKCCYSKAYRHKGPILARDLKVDVSECETFQDGAVVRHDVIVVKCTNFFLYQVYENVHALLYDTNITTAKMKQNLNDNRAKFSVTMIGMDSLSHLNLMRSMPETYFQLKEANFIGLKGYNKVGDNTFPNLIAILSGRTGEQYEAINDIEKVVVNNSLLIWDRFNQSGYITAYCEDLFNGATFNYYKRGFGDPPTDIYCRTYFLAVAKLPETLVEDATACTGPESTDDRVLNIANEFVDKFKDTPTFSLFWMSSFTHDDFNGGSVVDSKVKVHIKKIIDILSDEKSFIIVLSDHGFRFGKVTYTYAGWLESRLPFVYILVPDNFMKLYPEKYENLLINTKRLTSPFDIYMTLQDILALSDNTYQITPSQGCPTCHSLFTEVREDRKCRDAGIGSQWCTCTEHMKKNIKDPLVGEVVKFAVNILNDLVKNRTKCMQYKPVKAILAFQTKERDGEINHTTVIFTTKPWARFEATVAVDSKSNESKFSLKGRVYRISRYATTSKCENDQHMKSYCYCSK